MTRTLTCRLLLLVLLLTFSAVTTPAFAQRGEIYTIKKGDTLWDLSRRFIEDPYYWPNIWSDNPDITNPHLIFPGQKIRILDGRLEIIPAYTETGTTAPLMKSPQTPEQHEEILSITVAARGDGFILVNEQPQGRILDATDNRILLTETDMVFATLLNGAGASVGDSFGLYQRGKTVTLPNSKQKLGTMMHNLGSVEVTEVRGSTIVGRIDRAYREVTRGAELFFYNPPRRDVALQRGTAKGPGFIVATQDEKGTISTNDVIFINLGRKDELEVGNLIYISHPRQVTDEAIKGAEQLDLPEEVLGAAIITETRESTATAIMIKSVAAATIGDRVTVVTD